MPTRLLYPVTAQMASTAMTTMMMMVVVFFIMLSSLWIIYCFVVSFFWVLT